VDETNALFGESSEQLAASVVRLIQDTELREAMASANRQFVEANYTWQCVADQYEALYLH
jgi:glycosyltransferase involved in cell wall biosynthesis